ncbi:hypothetical protein [Streptomyces sp. NPDC004008]
MFGRTVLAATALAATALTAPAALPDAHAATRPVPLSNADNGRTVSVHSGDTVRVNLKAMSSVGEKWVWDVPAASDARVLPRTSGHIAANGDAEATFRAVHDGRSTITAHRRCVVTAPSHTCPHVVILWKATIDIR